MSGGNIPDSRTALPTHAGSDWTIRKALALLGLVAIFALQAEAVRAQSAVGSGLRLDVDTRWPDGAGYRPIRITITPTTPPTTDRILVFQIDTFPPYGYGRTDGRLSVTQEIELSAGFKPFTTTVAVPYTLQHTDYEIRVREGGQDVIGLSGWRSSFESHATLEGFPRVIAVADRRVNSNSFSRAFQNANMHSLSEPVMAISLKNLPTRWIDYSAIDILCVQIGDLRSLRTQRREAFEAILAWTAAGGNLLIYDLGSDWPRRSDLEKLLNLSPTDPESRDHAWHSPDLRQVGKPVEGNARFTLSLEDDEPENWEARRRRYRPAASFVSRPYEMGMVVAIATAMPFDEDVRFWSWLNNHLTIERVIWFQRHGISLSRENPEFFDFMIKGVGKAPLNAFRVLITLFVVVIGPVNYFLLRRLRRLHLLVVTVPVSAAVVTLALFAYAILTDGLGTRSRVRSMTRINQQTGRTECWARLSYYCGLTPGGGLTFSDDVAVYPIPGVEGDYPEKGRRLSWHDNQQNLELGWLRSRTPTQFLTVRSRKSDRAVEVGAPTEKGLPVVNRLGTDVEMLIVCDREGQLYWSHELPEEGKVEAEPVTPAQAASEFRRRLAIEKPVPPPGLNTSHYRRRRGYYRALSLSNIAGYRPPTFATSLMETAIENACQTLGLPEASLGPGGYLAIVPVCPEVELGTPSARCEDSFHLILGAF